VTPNTLALGHIGDRVESELCALSAWPDLDRLVETAR